MFLFFITRVLCLEEGQLATRRGKVTDYAVNFTVVALTPVCIGDIHRADLALGRFVFLVGM